MIYDIANDTTLAEILGLKMDVGSGMVRVGSLSRSACEILGSASTANPCLEKLDYGRETESDLYNPTLNRDIGDFWFHFSDIETEDFKNELDPLYALIPALKTLENPGAQFFKCDYLSLHVDTSMIGINHPGALVVLLDAPRGCKLVTNGTYQTELSPGDVVLIDDQLEHGVYPLERTDKVDRSKLVNLNKEDVSAFNDRNCLSFLLISSVIKHDELEDGYVNPPSTSK